MNTFLSRSVLICLSIACFISCKQENKPVSNQNKNEDKKSVLRIKYAKGFDIQEINGVKKIIIKSPYPNAKKEFSYSIIKKEKTIKALHKNEILVPIARFVATSTTHLPMITLLDEEKNLIGFPNTAYVSSKNIRKLIDAGQIKELGKEASLNTEILLDLKPELVIGFSMSKINKTFTILEQANIPIILNGDWMEETPLGRAEWIKFFGVLFDKEKQADSIFNTIEKNYILATKIAKKAKTKPTILSGAIMSKDIWNLPAGESFVAKFLVDANTEYLWKNTKGKGSLSLSFESVLDKGKDADFWISPGYFSSIKQLKNSSIHYQKFNAFKNETIFTPNLKKGETGGVIYYELAPTRPDLVLKDIIKITHPALLPNYEFTFFEKMK